MTRSTVVVGSRALAIVSLTVWAAAAADGSEHRVLAVSVAIATASGLWWHRRVPLLSLAMAFGGLLVVTGPAGFDGPDDPFLVVIVWSTYAVGRHASLHVQPWGAAAALLFLSLNVAEGSLLALPARVVFPLLLTAAPWLLGLTVRLAHERADRADALAGEAGMRAEALQRATETERMRVARELHDVAAHHLTAVSLQAQVLRRRAERGEAASADDLGYLEGAARQAMDELRRLTGVIRASGDASLLAPQPGIDDLDNLLEQCTRAGQSVELVRSGMPWPTSTGLSLSAYRIVQEALSNARHHGATGPVTAEVRWSADELRLRVTNPAGINGGQWTTGHGLIGMRERVSLFGGTMSAGPDDMGAWVVDVVLPMPVNT